ncbi:MAG: hypothetical protein JHC95_17190 [Solirubrobacteraceae bacterium]|nr:hypothetical protein [Solirubrobacteraceae bacterium]
MAEELYAAPLDAFVTERKALVAALRASGDKEGAKAAAALRKPSAAAWAINQLVHRHADLVSAFRSAAADARSAQVALASGGEREPWKAAMGVLREAQAALMDAAGELGVSATALGRAEATITAAAGDEDVEAEAFSGRLVREVEPGGFGGLLSEDIPLLERPTLVAVPAPTDEEEEDDGAERERALAAAREDLADAEDELARIRSAEDAAAAELARARAAREAAEEQVDAARRAVAQLGG